MQEKTGSDLLRHRLKKISHHPGVYRMLDENGTVLYVGKAKNLHNRLTSYTRTDQLSWRIRQMVSQIHDIIVIETAGETEAFLLESDLIKQYRPYYNILLKDDKSFPYIMISKDKFPRLTKYRGVRRTGNIYFGPFDSGTAVNKTVQEIQKIFGLRTCANTYFNNRTRPCLLHQIHRCSAPCVGYISQTNYQKSVEGVIDFMNGKTDGLQRDLTTQMQAFSTAEKYEQAAQIRDKILALNHIQNSDSYTRIRQTDFVGIYGQDDSACIQVFFHRGQQREGNIIQLLKGVSADQWAEATSTFLIQLYDRIGAPRFVCLSLPPEIGLEDALTQQAGHDVHLSAGPFRGERRKIMRQVMQNAEMAYGQHISRDTINHDTWEALRTLLNIQTLDKIEVYDNSHIQGTAAVGVMIAATEEGFQKKLYRRFNIDATKVKTNDDFGMMRHVLLRRLKNGDLPSAMLIDGGKGQLSSVIEVMNTLNIHDIAVLAIAKGENRNAGQETFYLGTDPTTPIHLDTNGALMHLLQRLRDESHRFAVGSHRIKRAKNMFHETLMDIDGIGEKRKKALLAHFGSARAVAGASLDQLMRVNGLDEKIAKKVYTFYHN